METFCVLCIVVIGCPKCFDGVDVVKEGVQLWEVEIVPNPKLDKNVFVLVKLFERLV